jgi:Protein of unknown function (DUF1579)
MTERTTRCGLALAAIFLLAGVLPAQDKAADAKKKQEELMAAYAKAAAPGPQHKLLNPIAGTWNFTAKFWMDPSAPPMDSKGIAVRKWILGGRFLTDEIEATGFGPEGFRGFGIMGYDNIQQKFNSFWVDSMTTAMSTSTGTADSAGKVFTYHKEDVDPVSKQKIKGRDVVTIETNDRHTMVMYKALPDGKEMKVGEIVFTRKK